MTNRALVFVVAALFAARPVALFAWSLVENLQEARHRRRRPLDWARNGGAT